MSSQISYRIATQEDSQELAELLNKHFYPNEPFNVGWINDDPVPEDVDGTLAVLAEGTTFIAIDDSKNIIVGACFSCVDEPSSVQSMLDEAKNAKSEKWAQFLRLFARIESEANIFHRFRVEKSFHVHCLVVNGDYRGRSIATKLVQKSFDLATSLGHKVCSVNCSSFYTEQIALKLKMQCVGILAMEDVTTEEGQRLIFPTEPHTHIRTYAKRL